MKELWSWKSLASRPLVSDGTVVVVPHDDVHCFELKTGKVVWEKHGRNEWGAHLPGCAWQGKYVGFLGGQLTALELKTGKVVWRWPLPDDAVTGWYPYDGRGYVFLYGGTYIVLDLASGKQVFERWLGRYVPEPVKGKKSGLMVGTRGAGGETWRANIVVSETHAFLTCQSGQIVALERETGEVVQVVEIDGMPVYEPAIYQNRLLLTDMSPDCVPPLPSITPPNAPRLVSPVAAS
jgi:outer membrane protein assembly factor BamB